MVEDVTIFFNLKNEKLGSILMPIVSMSSESKLLIVTILRKHHLIAVKARCPGKSDFQIFLKTKTIA